MSEGKRRIPIDHDRDGAGNGAVADGPSAVRPGPVAEGRPHHVAGTSSRRVRPIAEAGPAPFAAPADPESEETVVDPLAAVATERDSYLDALQRLKAEFDNFRKRADREVLEARARARMGLLAEFLPVFDNLDRALSAAEHHEEGKVLEGVRLTHVLFADLLRKEGVTEVDALGAPFDPHLHEAVMTQPSDQEEGLVTAVFEQGYVLGDRVLRPAKVVVSAGPTEV